MLKIYILVTLLSLISCNVTKPVVNPTTTTVLNGSGSYDEDGYLTGYLWRQILGGGAIIKDNKTVKTSVSFPSKGIYYFELTVTDNHGAQDKDTTSVTVK